MQALNSIEVTTDMVASTNVPEAVPAAHNGGTTYALGNQVGVFEGGTVWGVYESLQNSNTGHDPVASPLWWKRIAAVYEAHSLTKVYKAGDIVTDPVTHRLYRSLVGVSYPVSFDAATDKFTPGPTFQYDVVGGDGANDVMFVWASAVPAGPGFDPAKRYRLMNYTYEPRAFQATADFGANAVTASDSTVYSAEVFASFNYGVALTEPSYWQDIGYTNQFFMFDQKTGTQTSRDSSIEIVIDLPSRIDTVALLNIDAASTQIIVEDEDGNEVFNETQTLVDYNGINSWYRYLFSPVRRRSDIYVTGLPNVRNPRATLNVQGIGEVAVGSALFGTLRDIGGTQYGAQVGITDYSTAEEDEVFGNWFFVKRGYAKRGDFTVWIKKADVDAVFKLLAALRATPVFVIGSGAYEATLLYGIFRNWKIAIEYPDYSIATIEFRGI